MVKPPDARFLSISVIVQPDRRQRSDRRRGRRITDVMDPAQEPAPSDGGREFAAVRGPVARPAVDGDGSPFVH